MVLRGEAGEWERKDRTAEEAASSNASVLYEDLGSTQEKGSALEV